VSSLARLRPRRQRWTTTQEKRLRAADPLAARSADRTLPAALSGDMKAYVWKINGAAYPNRNSLGLRTGERVQIVFTNGTSMAHPMHLHGHDFEVVEIDGEKVSGPLRDTVLVPPGSKITIAFDADNLGIWALHCHLIYHLVTGMFTVLKDGADIKFWKPEQQARNFKTKPGELLKLLRRSADHRHGKRDFIGDFIEKLPRANTKVTSLDFKF
jgi:hypothetical protein